MKKAGAIYKGDNRCTFTVWAPEKEQMGLHLVSPANRQEAMHKDGEGYFTIELDNIPPGTRYFFSTGEKDCPDPASNHQPEGVHGASEVVDHAAFEWHDHHWRGLPFHRLILYELHVGTFTAEGTFEAIIPLLNDLVETGINAIELMPVAQFPGHRNWGYDGVCPYAVQHSYGGPQGLKKLVDACHQKGIAVFLDVIYNHLGPEGNYLPQYGPYFTDHYHVPWGMAINFDGPWSDGVKEYFSNNVVYWFEQYHIDGLRFDAVQFIFDNNAVTIWDIIYQKVKRLEQELGRRLYLTAESDYNSPKVIGQPANGGWGMDAQWLDDFHHALYVLLDANGIRRYEDYGTLQQLAKAYTDGFVHSGEYVKFRKRKHGSSSAGISGDRFIVFNHNHDQVGNRVRGERLSLLVDFERLKLAAAALLLSPYIPLLFMGEEYGEDAPFFFFSGYTDETLIKAVREGRRKEFEAFLAGGEEFPDPQAEETFMQSKLQWHKRKQGKYKILLQWHKELIRLRNTHPILQNHEKNNIRIQILQEKGFVMYRQSDDGKQHLICLFNLSDETLSYTVPHLQPEWHKITDSKQAMWMISEQPGNREHPQQIKSNETHLLQPCSIVIYE